MTIKKYFPLGYLKYFGWFTDILTSDFTDTIQERIQIKKQDLFVDAHSFKTFKLFEWIFTFS